MKNRLRFSLSASLLALALITTTLLASDGKTVTLSLQDIDCQSCGQAVAKMLRREDGVRSTSFDLVSAEITVELADKQGRTPPRVDDLIERVRRAGYRAVAGGGQGRYLPSEDFPEGLDVEWLSRAGEEADVESGLVDGKVTVVDYYAIWCGPCREIDKEMKRILAEAPDVALRKINVVDWSSPVAREHLGNVGGLPYVEVYSTTGKRVAAIEGLDLERLRKAIEKGRKR